MLRDPINRTAVATGAGARHLPTTVNTALYAPSGGVGVSTKPAAGRPGNSNILGASSAASTLSHSLSRLQEVRNRLEDYVRWTQRAWDDLVGTEADAFCGCSFVEFAGEITGAAGMSILHEQIEALNVLENGMIGIIEEFLLKCEVAFSGIASIPQLHSHRSSDDLSSLCRRSPSFTSDLNSAGDNGTSSIRDTRVRDLRLLLSIERRQDVIIMAVKLISNIRKSSQWKREDREGVSALFDSFCAAQEQHHQLLTLIDETLRNCWS